MVSLLYAFGLRLQECVQLRVKDVDLRSGQVAVRRSAREGHEDRATPLPRTLVGALRGHLAAVHRQHQADLAAGAGFALPEALGTKYPGAARQWIWQWVEAGYDIRTIQKLLGHIDLRTTMIYSHVLGRGPLGVRSPLDAMVDGLPSGGEPSTLPGSTSPLTLEAST
jgi:site-specific recombinase XerD